MSYHLDAWVAKMEAFDALGIKSVPLAQGFALTTEKPVNFPTQIAWLFASFFGGGGEQESTVWTNETQQSFGPDYGAINEALKLLGVVADRGKDEFDTLGLSRHRDNDWMPNDYDYFEGGDGSKGYDETYDDFEDDFGF